MPEYKKKVCFNNKGRSRQEIEDKKEAREQLWCPQLCVLFVLTHKAKKKTCTFGRKISSWWQVQIVCSGSTLDCLCFPESTVGSMRRECLNICSGNDLLRQIPHGSTYISVAPARGGVEESTADNLSQTLCAEPSPTSRFIFLEACISTWGYKKC